MTAETDYLASKEDSVTVDFKSEMMENYFPESIVEASENIRSLMVDQEEPMVFCLDRESKLQAILRVEGSSAGWVKLPLSEDKVTAFDIEYNKESDTFRVAKAEGNKAWVSQELALKTTPFEKLDEIIEWDECQSDNPTEEIHRVALGVEHLLYATSSAGHNAQYYLLDLVTQQQSQYTLPESGNKILQFELGNFENSHGVFVLYEVGHDTTMLYQSFPDRRFNRMTQRRLSTGDTIKCFALLEGDRGQDIVYAGGKGIHEFRPAANRRDIEVTKLPGDDKEVSKIRVAAQDDELSVWALNDDGLYYQTNRFYEQASDQFYIGKWTDPIIMDEDAEQFSCVKGKSIRNQLFTFSSQQGSRLTRLWQDAVTTLWNKHEVHIQELDNLREVECYSSHIRFKTDTPLRLFKGLSVKLSADSHLFVYVNSTSYHIGPDEPVEIELDLSGEFTVICPVKDISSALLFIEADFLEHDIVINPADNVMKKLGESSASAEVMSKLKKPNGELLIPENVEKDKLDQAAKAIQEMVKTAEEMAKTADQKAKASKLSEERMQTHFTQNVILATGTGHALGDFLHSVVNVAREVVSIVSEVVGDAVHFIITIGDLVWDWVVNTVREVGSFIQTVFESIVVFFEDLFEFLAFLFNWQGILRCKDALKGLVNNGFLSLRDEIGSLRQSIIEQLDRGIENFTPELNALPASLSSQLDVTKAPAETSADPTSNWINSKQGYLEMADEPVPTEITDVLGDFANEVGRIFAELGEAYLDQLNVPAEALSELIHGRMSFLEFLQMLLDRFVGFSLLIVRQLMDLILTTLEALIELAQAGMNQAWNIPLLSPLYRLITRTPQNPQGSELTFLDLLSLLVAIPTTIFYRIGERTDPFPDQQSVVNFAQNSRNIFQIEADQHFIHPKVLDYADVGLTTFNAFLFPIDEGIKMAKALATGGGAAFTAPTGFIPNSISAISSLGIIQTCLDGLNTVNKEHHWVLYPLLISGATLGTVALASNVASGGAVARIGVEYVMPFVNLAVGGFTIFTMIDDPDENLTVRNVGSTIHQTLAPLSIPPMRVQPLYPFVIVARTGGLVGRAVGGWMEIGENESGD
ncbi:MAG: hypothetical protein HEP71_12970 [Roseivirga sp.]|nr:hypothetical protein [Roseivirga sp.]